MWTVYSRPFHWMQFVSGRVEMAIQGNQAHFQEGTRGHLESRCISRHQKEGRLQIPIQMNQSQSNIRVEII